MPNPEGINQYGNGGSKSGEKSSKSNAHPDHKAPTQGERMKAAFEHGAKGEGYSTGKSRRGDR